MCAQSRVRLASVGLLLALAPASFLSATTVREVDLPEMVNAADRIFVGRCVAVESRRDERGAPTTYVTFRVAEGIKGQFGRTIAIKQIGGGSQSLLHIADMPSYSVGEEVLLFLHPNSRLGFTSPVGLHQGKWSVVESKDRTKLVRSSLHAGRKGKGPQGSPYGDRGKERQEGETFRYDALIPHLKKLASSK